MERKLSNPKDRSSTSKLDLSLFPDTAVIAGAVAMTEGDLKYGGYNYRIDGVSYSVYVAACRRHLNAAYNGEEEDPSTRVPHLWNAIACLAVLIDAQACGKLIDDRPPQCPVGRIQRNAQTLVEHLQNLFHEPPNRLTWKNDTPPEVTQSLSGNECLEGVNFDELPDLLFSRKHEGS